MELHITGKQIDIGDALRTHARSRVQGLSGKFFTDPIDASVTFAREGSGYRADCTLHLRSGIYLHAHGHSPDIYACFDQAAERLEKRLRRHKRRLKDMHNGIREPFPSSPGREMMLAAPEETAPENEGHEPVIVAEAPTSIRTLTVSEAVMQLDLTDSPAIVFRNAAHGQINVVYRRHDKHIGWIDPTLPKR